MSKEVDWGEVYEYLNEHKDEYCFNSILNGIIEASNNKEIDQVNYYEKIFAVGKYDYPFVDNIEVVAITDDDREIKVEFCKFIQNMARTEERDKFDIWTEDKSFLLGWLSVCPYGTCACNEAYTGKFKEVCGRCDCYEYGEECNCANAYCFHVEDLAPMLKKLLPGINL